MAATTLLHPFFHRDGSIPLGHDLSQKARSIFTVVRPGGQALILNSCRSLLFAPLPRKKRCGLETIHGTQVQQSVPLRWAKATVLRMPAGTTTDPSTPDRIRWLETEGQRVLLVDLSYRSCSRVEDLIRNAGQVIRSQPLGSTLVL